MPLIFILFALLNYGSSYILMFELLDILDRGIPF